MINFINIPYLPWYIAGPAIALIMLLLNYFNKSFGISSTLEHLCTLAGAGKFNNYFNVDMKKMRWRLIFAVGIIFGGYLGSQIHQPKVETISPLTLEALPSSIQVDPELMIPLNFIELNTNTIILLILGGLLIGFGTRYAGGCTSGHAITGISSLQKASIVATIGFFGGGLIMTHFIYPLLF